MSALGVSIIPAPHHPLAPSIATWLGFAMMCIGMFMAILDIQVVASSFPNIGAALHISQDRLSWIQTCYLIAEIIGIPLTGFMTRVLTVRWLFAGATLIVSGLIVLTAFRSRNAGSALGLGLVLGGALGNLADRALRGPGLSGHVVDFIDLHWWPVFNVADSAIVIGAVLLAWTSFRDEHAGEAAAGTPHDAT